MKELTVKCRVCGKNFQRIAKDGLNEILNTYSYKCKLGDICCDCGDQGFGCYGKPLVRHSMLCPLNPTFDFKFFALPNLEKYYGASEGKIRKNWRILVTKKLGNERGIS